MELSKESEFLCMVLGSDEVGFDEDGLYSLESDQGVGITFVHMPPELRLYASPLTPEEYESIDDKVSFLEAVLAINYASDVAAYRGFKTGFHPRVRIPMIAAVAPTEQIQIGVPEIEAAQKLCDNLHTAALNVREIALYEAGAQLNIEELSEPEFKDQDAPWSLNGPGLQA